MKSNEIHREHEREIHESSRTPGIQRAGFCVLGIFFLLVGIASWSIGLEDHSLSIYIFSILLFLASLRMFLSAFKVDKARSPT
jgi:hypothetical protein